MEHESPEALRLIEYLLGTLPQQEVERLDKLIVSDEAFASRLHAIENDLVEAYANGELTGAVLERFQSYCLCSPRRREKVKIAQALVARRNRASEASTARRVLAALRIPRWAFAAPAAILLLAGSYMLFRSRDRADEHLTLSTQPGKPITSSPSAANTTLAVLLAPPTRGNARMPVITVPAGIDRVSFELEMQTNDFALYRAQLKSSSSGEILWRSGDLQPSSKLGLYQVSVELPASVLPSRNYVLEISGVRAPDTQPVGSYVFSVTR